MKVRHVITSALAVGLLSLGPLASIHAGAGSPDVNQGRDLFAKRCSGCHALDSDKEGPRLGGVFAGTPC